MIDISFHRVARVSATSESGAAGSHWVDLKITDNRKRTQEITLFFNSRVHAGIFAKSINDAQVSAEAMVEAINA